jgi:hypothetical protein
MARKPCRRCRQVRLSALVVVVFVLLGYGLLKTSV